MRNVEGIGGGRDMPTNDDIVGNNDYVISRIDCFKPLNYEILKSEIEKNGPLQVVYPELKIKYNLNITECTCCFEKCSNDCILLTQISGFTTLSTSIDKKKLLECNSLMDFLKQFQLHPIMFYSSSAEQQQFEAKIEEHLGFTPMDFYRGDFDFEDLEKVSVLSAEAEKDVWLQNNLYQGLLNLQLHRTIIGEYSGPNFKKLLDEDFEDGDSFRKFLWFLYDLGFYSGRTLSEYFVRTELEPIAEKGITAQKNYEDKGKKSKSDLRKKERLDAFIEKVETVFNSNPAIRKYENMVLRTAFDLVVPEGTYGHGQFEEYCTKIRSEYPYKSRFDRLFY